MFAKEPLPHSRMSSDVPSAVGPGEAKRITGLDERALAAVDAIMTGAQEFTPVQWANILTELKMRSVKALADNLERAQFELEQQAKNLDSMRNA